MVNKSVSEAEVQLRTENEELQQRLAEAEETLYAIRNGEVDAIVVSGAEGARIFSLTSAETPYRIMVEEMHEGAATLMADTTIIHCNSRFAEMVACPAGQIIGASFSQFIGENEKPAFTRLFNSGLAGKSSGEISWLSPGNEIHYFHLSFSPLPADVTGDVCVIVSDFTEQKRAAEAIRLHVFLNNVIDNSPNALWILDEQGTLTQMNQASQTLFSLHDEEVIGKYNILNDTVFEEQGLMSLIHDVFEKASIVRFVARYDTASGRGIQAAQILKLDLDVSISPILDPHGKVSNAVVQFTDITERKLAEEALKLSGERYRFSLESTGQIGWSTPPDGVVDDMPMWREYSGQSLEEVVGWKWLDAVHPDDRESAYLAWSTAAAQKINYFTEYRIRRADGVYRNFMVRGIPLLNTDGSCKEWVGTCIDITDSKKTEQELRESESKFKNLVRDMPVGVLLQGPQSEMLLSNPKALELLGLTEDQLLGKTSFDPDWNVIHEDGSPFPGETHPVPQAIATGLPVKNVIMGIYNPINDNRAWLLVDAIPQFDADGNVHQVVCTFVDISKRRQAEEELRISEEKYKSVFDQSVVGKSLTSVIDGKMKVNNAFCEMLGYSEAELLAMNWKTITSPDDLERDQKIVDSLISGEKETARWEKQYIHKNGNMVRVDISTTIQRDKANNPLFFNTSLIDITQRKKAEEDLKRKMDELLQFQRLTVDRELKMIELKKEVNELLKGSGKDEKYRIVE